MAMGDDLKSLATLINLPARKNRIAERQLKTG
jgi:hypothetical protein